MVTSRSKVRSSIGHAPSSKLVRRRRDPQAGRKGCVQSAGVATGAHQIRYLDWAAGLRKLGRLLRETPRSLDNAPDPAAMRSLELLPGIGISARAVIVRLDGVGGWAHGRGSLDDGRATAAPPPGSGPVAAPARHAALRLRSDRPPLETGCTRIRWLGMLEFAKETSNRQNSPHRAHRDPSQAARPRLQANRRGTEVRWCLACPERTAW